MTDAEIIKNRPAGLPWPEGTATLLARNGSVSVIPENYKWRKGDRVVVWNFSYGSVQLEDIPLNNYSPEFVGAEEWLSLNGYGSIRLVALLDMENKIKSAGKNSNKLSSARLWIDGIFSSFLQDSSPRSDWSLPPYSFEEISQEVFQVLLSN